MNAKSTAAYVPSPEEEAELQQIREADLKRKEGTSADERRRARMPKIGKIGNIGRIIREWRQADPPMTREELAIKTGRCMSTIRNWEKNREPRVSDIQSMEEVKPGLVGLLFPEAL